VTVGVRERLTIYSTTPQASKTGGTNEVLVLKILGVIIGFGQVYLLVRLFCYAAEQQANSMLDKARSPKTSGAKPETPSRDDESYDGDEFAGLGVIVAHEAANATSFIDDDTWWSNV